MKKYKLKITHAHLVALLNISEQVLTDLLSRTNELDYAEKTVVATLERLVFGGKLQDDKRFYFQGEKKIQLSHAQAFALAWLIVKLDLDVSTYLGNYTLRVIQEIDHHYA